MKRKINVVAICNFIGLIISLVVILDTIYHLLILPFIVKETTAITFFGTLILVMAIYTFVKNLRYFKKRLKRGE